MHSDLTLEILNKQTTHLGEKFHHFKMKVCTAYHTQELDHEVDARSRRQTKDAIRHTEGSMPNSVGQRIVAQKRVGDNAKGKQKANFEQLQDPCLPRPSRMKKSLNLKMYKFHVLGDYVTSICRFGTTELYSTEPVSYFYSLSAPYLNYYKGELEH
jgi:hypothetical protein